MGQFFSFSKGTGHPSSYVNTSCFIFASKRALRSSPLNRPAAEACPIHRSTQCSRGAWLPTPREWATDLEDRRCSVSGPKLCGGLTLGCMEQKPAHRLARPGDPPSAIIVKNGNPFIVVSILAACHALTFSGRSLRQEDASLKMGENLKQRGGDTLRRPPWSSLMPRRRR